MAEETVILKLEVDQGAAEKQLERIEGVLLDNKKAVQELQAAYKKGNITQGEYVRENIRLQQNIKKEQDLKKTLIKTIETESNSRNSLKNRISTLVKEYDNLNLAEAKGIKRADELEKELSQLNAQLNKGDKAAGLFKNQIGNYPQTFQDAAKNINIAGTSIGDIGTKLAAFANPATAALGIVTALGTAYAKSTIGAKDLEFAQNQLSAAFTLASNSFAEFISSAEDGEGIVSSFVDNIIVRFGGAGAAAVTKFSATLKEDLQDLGRLEDEVRVNANQRIEENQELLEKIADEQVNINDKIQAAVIIEQNLEINKKNILSVLKDQLSNLENQLKLDKDNDALLDLVIDKRKQISQESSSLEKQLTRINKQQDDLNSKLAEEVQKRKDAAAAAQTLFEFDVREANAPPGDLTAKEFDFAGGIDDPVIAASKARQDQYIAELKTVELTEEEKRRQAQISSDFQKSVDQAKVQSAKIVFSALSQLAQEGSAEQKALTLISIALDTAQAIAGATAASQDIPYPGNLVAMATSIATVLSNIAAATQLIKGFEEGGYTGDGGKHDVAGIVHKGEYVVPQSVNYAPAAQPYIHALESMRTRGYADGGFVANQSTAPVNQSLIIANVLKNLPPTYAVWTEGRQLGKNIEFRESMAKL